MLVRFNKEEMKSVIEGSRKEWEKFEKGEEYKNIAADESRRNDAVDDFLTSTAGYEITITARVYPKEGEPFDINVGNYSTVTVTQQKLEVSKKEKGSAKVTADKKAKEPKPETVRTVTTSVERRPYRLASRLRLDDLSRFEMVEEDEIVDGVLELGKEKLSDGDRLEILVTNYHGSVTRVNWFLELRDCGLKIKQDATLLLVKRAGEPKGVNDVDSNFKPAPGSSFLLRVVTRNRALNFIEPSFGINGSFLDFQKDKDLEVGVGPTVSIFNGIVQFTVGWNLNAPSDRRYWAIGLGFLDIAGKIKELSKK